MAFTVSVRELEDFGERIRNGEKITIPKECKPNSDIVYEVLTYANRILPEFDLLTDEEKRLVSDVVAYVMRPDNLKEGILRIGPSQLREKLEYDGNPSPFYNDPAELNSEWELPGTNENVSRGGEYFRCFSCVMAWIPGMYDKLEPKHRSLAPAFKLSDLCAFLIDPNELQDYDYTPEEIANFNQTLEREVQEV